jgi:hypothetical protein
MRLKPTLVVALFCLGLFACDCGTNPPPVISSCQSAADCAANQVCEQGACVVPAGLTWVTSELADGEVGQPYAATLDVRGGQAPLLFELTAGALPEGLLLGSDGSLSGTPVAEGTQTFTVEAKDAAGATATAQLSLTVLPAPDDSLQIVTTSLPEAQLGTAYQASLVATGGEPPYLWSVSLGQLPAGLTLSEEGLLSGTPEVGGSSSFVVQVRDAATPPAARERQLLLIVRPASGEPLQITTTTLPPGTVGTAYSHALQAQGGSVPYVWSLVGGALPGGLTLSADGVLGGVATTAGTFELTIQAQDGESPAQVAQAALTLTVENRVSGLVVTTTALPPATVGTAYDQTLVASGGTEPYTWALQTGELPQGLTLSAAGRLFGTPTAAGNFTFTVEVTDSETPAQTASRQLTLLVNTPGGLAITTQVLPNGTVGAAYTAQLNAAGGTAPYSYSIVTGALPPGITLSAEGALSGTPTLAGTFTFTARVTDSATPEETADRTLSLTVNPPAGALLITTIALPPGRVNQAYSFTLSATNGTAPYEWSVIAGTLPAGISLSVEGVLGGTPSAPGSSTFTVQVSDASTPAETASRQFTLQVLP